jgi:hypothetical protein
MLRPHDECFGGGSLVELGPVLVGSVEHPGVQLVAPAVAAVVAERAFLGLVEPGRVPVGRDREVAGHPAHTFGHCSLLLVATSVTFAVSWDIPSPQRTSTGMSTRQSIIRSSASCACIHSIIPG